MPSALKDRVTVQTRTVTTGALGETETWADSGTYYARVIPLDAKARAAYQQLNSVVTHKVLLRRGPILAVGTHRFTWGSKTLVIVDPPQTIDQMTTVVVSEA